MAVAIGGCRGDDCLAQVAISGAKAKNNKFCGEGMCCGEIPYWFCSHQLRTVPNCESSLNLPEHYSICGQMLELFKGNRRPSGEKASFDESKVFYHTMKADFYSYITEFKTDDAKKAAADNAHKAYNDASRVASAVLLATHPMRLDLALK